MSHSCVIGKETEKDVFTSTRPFRNFQNFTYHLYDVYGEGFTTFDGEEHYRVRLNDRGRGNVTVNICKTSGTGLHEKTEDFGCDKLIINKTTKRMYAHQFVEDFVRKHDLLHLPMESEEKDLFRMITHPSQIEHFKLVEHCAIGFPDKRRPDVEFSELKDELKNHWHWSTWGDADVSIPELGIEQGKTAIEYFKFEPRYLEMKTKHGKRVRIYPSEDGGMTVEEVGE